LGERREEMTARLRPVLITIGVALVMLAFAGPSLAASPQQIYRDLADNGRLDRRYSEADLARAFNLERVVGTDETPMRRPAAASPSPASANHTGRKIPFSGLDLALLTAGGGPLLLIGLGLRRRITASPGVVGS
jgi:hypothetical protein